MRGGALVTCRHFGFSTDWHIEPCYVRSLPRFHSHNLQTFSHLDQYLTVFLIWHGQVRSIVCVQTSSDLGAHMPPKMYHPASLPLGRARVGKGDKLVLLHELRAARMSHYQLIQFASIV